MGKHLDRAAIRLEREKRRTLREERLWALLSRPEVVTPVIGIGGMLALQQAGHSRVINRDFAGYLLAAWTALVAAQAGITDKYALGAITAAATAAYSVSTPPEGSEVMLELHPSKLLGGDGKLFFWNIPFLPENA